MNLIYINTSFMHILSLIGKSSLKGETEKPLPETKLFFKCNAENNEIFEIPLLQIEKSNMKDKVKNKKILKLLCFTFMLCNSS